MMLLRMFHLLNDQRLIIRSKYFKRLMILRSRVDLLYYLSFSPHIMSHSSMTDDFTLRWEVDNPSVTLANGRAESGVFNERGFKWIAAVEEDPDYGCAKFTLRCDADDARAWQCEADVEVAIVNEFEESESYGHKIRHCFNANAPLWEERQYAWHQILDGTYSGGNNNITLEFRVCIIGSKREEPIVQSTLFAAPNTLSNVILKIGENKLHVSKELLAIHSPVFNTLFFGEFAEKGKDEVELKDVDYEEFIDLLHLIYLENVKITDHRVLLILKLADQFRVERVLNLVSEHLKQSTGFDAVKKLLLADQFNLISLKDHCIQSFMSEPDPMGKLKAFPEFDNFSDRMKIEIFNRLVKKQ